MSDREGAAGCTHDGQGTAENKNLRPTGSAPLGRKYKGDWENPGTTPHGVDAALWASSSFRVQMSIWESPPILVTVHDSTPVSGPEPAMCVTVVGRAGLWLSADFAPWSMEGTL